MPLSFSIHWGGVKHICVSKVTIVDSGNGLSPVRRQAIIWTNAGILLIEPLGINFSEILLKKSNSFIQKNAFENVVWPFCLSVLTSSPKRVRSS